MFGRSYNRFSANDNLDSPSTWWECLRVTFLKSRFEFFSSLCKSKNVEHFLLIWRTKFEDKIEIIILIAIVKSDEYSLTHYRSLKLLWMSKHQKNIFRKINWWSTDGMKFYKNVYINLEMLWKANMLQN